MAESVATARMRQEKKAVALNSIYAAIAITLLKAMVGVTTGSLGILSEAAHSGLDLVAAAIRSEEGGRPQFHLCCDRHHATEGHGRRDYRQSGHSLRGGTLRPRSGGGGHHVFFGPRLRQTR